MHVNAHIQIVYTLCAGFEASEQENARLIRTIRPGWGVGDHPSSYTQIGICKRITMAYKMVYHESKGNENEKNNRT
jgi:hypothetical protein